VYRQPRAVRCASQAWFSGNSADETASQRREREEEDREVNVTSLLSSPCAHWFSLFKIFFISGTDLLSPLILLLLLFFFFLLGQLSLNKTKAPSFKIESGWNLAVLFFNSIDWRNRISGITSYFQDGGLDVISCKKSTADWWVHTLRLPVYDPLYIRTCSSTFRFSPCVRQNLSVFDLCWEKFV